MPAEPDPDEPMAENSKQLLESQLLSEVDPGNLIQIIQKMERNHFPIRGKWRIGNSTWEKDRGLIVRDLRTAWSELVLSKRP